MVKRRVNKNSENQRAVSSTRLKESPWRKDPKLPFGDNLKTRCMPPSMPQPISLAVLG